MKKEHVNIITFIFGVVCTIAYIFTNNLLLFGFSLLFDVMFVVDSFWHFLKRFFLKDKMKPIGVQ